MSDDQTAEVLAKLNALADKLVPVAGTLMMVATSNGRCAREPDVHEEHCDCQVCKAFLATQAVITGLDEAIKSIKGEGVSER